MKRAAVYSGRSKPAAQAAAAPVAKPARATWREWRQRHARGLRMLVLGSMALLLGLTLWGLTPPRGMSQTEVEALVQKALGEKREPVPSAADAYEAILPSVVFVRGTPDAPDADVKAEGDGQSGSGVVIVDNGTILTNLHVVQGAKRITVTFSNGQETDAVVIGVQPEHDLAVLRAKVIPDDLMAATMRSTQGLRPGDEVVAVGFPFGIGPSVSAGVISGLGREYHSAQGKRLLTNLIQFDAAANPGNSGGPLINMNGEVLGIVTAILNPTQQRTFIGIGFAVPIENAATAAGSPPF